MTKLLIKIRKIFLFPVIRWIGYRLLLFFLFLPAIVFAQQNVFSISGAWQFSLDSLNIGESEKWYNKELSDQIILPGSVDQGCYGAKHSNGMALYDGQPEIYRIARRHVYIGPAWFRKEITIPPSWEGKQIFLNLERCLWQSKLWINGNYVGENISLCTPHQFDISRFFQPGRNIVDDELYKKVYDGATLLLVTDDFPDTEQMRFTTPFWSTIMFDYQEKTMGALCNPTHSVFKNFPTDFYTNWQWWELTKDARVLRLNNTNANYRPILQIIDNPVRNDKLGAIMEIKIGKGKMLICTLDILNNLEERLVARQLKKSILEYMGSDEFNPEENEELTKMIFNKGRSTINSIVKIESSSESSENPALFAFDADEKSYWESNNKDSTMRFTIELKNQKYVTGCVVKCADANYASFKFNIYITNNISEYGKPVIIR